MIRFAGIGTAMSLLIVQTAPASSTGVGYILADPTGKVIASQNADQPFVPASTFKLLTALGAMHTLGENFKFKTQFFLGQDLTLKVKGSGDPLLTSEILETLCYDLALTLFKRGISKIRGIEVDNLFFEPDIDIPGTGSSTNPYDAGVAALSANFNTVSFKLSTQPGQPAQYLSAEPQTPLLDFTHKRILGSGLHRGRIILSRDETRTYGGRLIKFFLEKQGIEINGNLPGGMGEDQAGGVKEGRVNGQDLHIYTHVSPHSLTDLVQRLLKYSNNFMANQIFLTAGAEAFLPPANLEKAIKALSCYAMDTLGLENITIAEGSGISRKNTIPPREMLKVLMAFKPFHGLMNSGKNEFYKTGTLTGVRTLAGYFTTGKDKSLYPYVIMVNHPKKDCTRIRERLKDRAAVSY
ncbi:MAG: D-alanyl-D-alanine carboxypeptidase [Desulfobacterium sp.]|nr:D-alanyl-D-alanine carboxypeptidase [Desulfobacterium sp.]